MDGSKSTPRWMKAFRAVYPILCGVNAAVWLVLAVKEPTVPHIVCAAGWTLAAAAWAFAAVFEHKKEKRNV